MDKKILGAIRRLKRPTATRTPPKNRPQGKGAEAKIGKSGAQGDESQAWWEAPKKKNRKKRWGSPAKAHSAAFLPRDFSVSPTDVSPDRGGPRAPRGTRGHRAPERKKKKAMPSHHTYIYIYIYLKNKWKRKKQSR